MTAIPSLLAVLLTLTLVNAPTAASWAEPQTQQDATNAPSKSVRPVSPARPADPGGPNQLVDPKPVEDDMVWLINQRRASEGLEPLGLAPQMIPVVREWAATMMAKGEIFHSADLAKYGDVMGAGSWYQVGENVGVGQSFVATGAAAMNVLDQAFWDSPKHKENVLGKYTNVAVGAVDDGERLFVAVAFADFTVEVPGAYQPTSNLHDGVLTVDKPGPAADGLTISGRAYDPDGTPPVSIALDGATLSQPVSLPASGSTFDSVVETSPGPHQLCVTQSALKWGAGPKAVCVDATATRSWSIGAAGSLGSLVAPGYPLAATPGPAIPLRTEPGLPWRRTVDIESARMPDGTIGTWQVTHAHGDVSLSSVGLSTAAAMSITGLDEKTLKAHGIADLRSVSVDVGDTDGDGTPEPIALLVDAGGTVAVASGATGEAAPAKWVDASLLPMPAVTAGARATLSVGSDGKLWSVAADPDGTLRIFGPRNPGTAVKQGLPGAKSTPHLADLDGDRVPELVIASPVVVGQQRLEVRLGKDSWATTSPQQIDVDAFSIWGQTDFEPRPLGGQGSKGTAVGQS